MTTNIPFQYVMDPQYAWKSALMGLVEDDPIHFGITLTWNRPVGMERAHADLADLNHRIDRQLLGSRFHRYPAHKRTRALFAFEGMSYGHVHVHSVWRAAKGKWFELGKMFPKERGGVWNAVVSSGSYKVTFANQIGSNAEITGYMLKEQHKSSAPFTLVWSDELF